jgi:uncharacterized protein (TIGR03000 family)
VAYAPAFSGRVDTSYAAAVPAGKPATVTVQLPSDARLYADGQPVQFDPATKSFATPSLNSGEDYEYTLKAEVLQGGRILTESKTVKVRAGQTTQVAFDNLRAPGREAEVAQAPARITVQLPARAKLYVNNVLWTTRSFDTPTLTKGHEYSYDLRAELEQNGQTIREAKTVKFQAGAKLTVEFETLIAAEAATARK